jgi:hypothetical protein
MLRGTAFTILSSVLLVFACCFTAGRSTSAVLGIRPVAKQVAGPAAAGGANRVSVAITSPPIASVTLSHAGLQGVQFSSDGRQLATWSTDGTVRVWSLPGPVDASYDRSGTPPNGHASWSPMQAAGEPDTHRAGDCVTAWASDLADGGKEWLELTYATPLRAETVRIHETDNPGAVTEVVLLDERGEALESLSIKDPLRPAPSFLEVTFPRTERPVKRVKLGLDTTRSSGWNEIDAVELVGPDGRAWASQVRASSYYGQPKSASCSVPAATGEPADPGRAVPRAVRRSASGL